MNINLGNKKYALIYLIIICLFSLSFLQYDDYLSPLFEIGMLILIFVIGSFSLYYYTQNEDNLHKVAFIIILLFGITCVFLTPINDVSDEQEHFVRSEILSTGQLSTTYIPIPNTSESGYQTINSIIIFCENAGANVFNTDVDDAKIDYTPNYFNSAFSQNPFYSYLPQAIGIVLAKLLDLNAIWMLWLGRLFNLLVYAGIISLAIRKSPILKFQLLIVSILPLAIYQAASMSVDGMFSAFAILAFAYFLYFYKTPKIKWIDLAIFYGAIILSGILKSPFLALSLLIFLIPNNHFESKLQNIVSKLAILPTLGIGIGWSSYATSVLSNSWRGDFFITKHVNATEQINYLASNPGFAFERFLNVFSESPVIADRLFYFSNDVRDYSSTLLSALYTLSFIAFSIIYPLEEKFEIKTRIKGLLIGLLIYIGVIAVQYLTWSSVGATSVINGVFARYFMPLLIFVPFIINADILNYDKEELSLLFLTVFLSFIGGMLMLTTAVKY
ncbi:MAG: DUF2142 domain-containing protein [Methanobrevibacter sp.]|nr:DUF2142 domain-containing protein [Methanobrevibacter sp.]